MKVFDLIFPPKCIVCNAVLKRHEKHVCGRCRKALPRVSEPSCARCGKPLLSVRKTYCLDCEEKRRRNDVLTAGKALWVYDRRMKRAMANIKYNGCREDMEFFSEEVCRFYGKNILRWNVDAIVPVPLYRKRKWFRGYNQASELAKSVGERLRIPVVDDVLVRVRGTKPQKGLEPEERKRNVSKAFQIRQKKSGALRRVKRVLLIDDIYTTGATLEACGEVLRAVGVQEIFFICLCIGRDY